MLGKLLGSRLRAKLIGWLFAHHDERYFVRQLTELLEEDSTNISRELARLEKMGILTCAKEGKQKYYRANSKCAIFEELRGLAIKTMGLVDVLSNALAPIASKIDMAFLYGSQANNTSTWESDIDLLVVGSIDETALHKAVRDAEDQLKRPVSYRFMSQQEFQRRRKEKEGFLSRILSASKIPIIGSPDEV